MEIHPTAQVDPRAKLGPDVVVGPNAVVGPHITMGARTELGVGVVVTGHTTMGCDNKIYPYAVIGSDPQDLTYTGEPTRAELGHRNIIREYVTVNTGTTKDHAVTKIGNDNMIMAYSHVAHDCEIGNRVIMANAANLGGHVHIGDGAILSGLVGVHHFVTIGELAFVGGMTRVVKDVPPFMIVEGNPARVRVVNVVGLKRNGFSSERIEAIKFAHRLMFRSAMNTSEAFRRLESNGLTPDVERLMKFHTEVQSGRQGRALEASRTTAAH